MEKIYIKDYWKKKKKFKRINDFIYNCYEEDEGTQSIANICKIGDIVNEDEVVSIALGMNYCYCVYTRNGHCYYSWNIDTIQTKTKKYKVVQEKDFIYIKDIYEI